MRAHPLDVTAPAGEKMKFVQPCLPQIGPEGDGARVMRCVQSGMGASSATMVFDKEYLRIVETVHLVSSTIEPDKGHGGAKS